jgi:uncharacterized protein YutD
VNPDADRIVDQQWMIREVRKLNSKIGLLNEVLDSVIIRLNAIETRKPVLRRSSYPIPEGLFENLRTQGFHQLSRADYPTMKSINNLNYHLQKWCQEAGEDYRNYNIRAAGPDNIMIMKKG